MKILFIYRNPAMGHSIGKVFRPIEKAMKNNAEVDSIEMPYCGYSIKCLFKNTRFVRHVLEKKQYDIIHITGTEHYLLPFLRKHNVVLTVHDLGFYTNFGKNLKQWLKYLLWIRTLPIASHITFISNKSKEEAEQFVNFPKGKVSVVYDPIGDDYRYTPKLISKDKPLILHIGTNPHKNLIRTIEALADFPCKLIIIGKINNQYRELLLKNKIDFENKCDLSDDEILAEYQRVDLVNFPSLHEGFGMPIIEGQSIGRPVLTSNITPMKEIAGDGAVLVDPENVEQIRNGYEKLLSNSDEYIQKGLENVKRFRLNNIVNQYIQLYKKLLS